MDSRCKVVQLQAGIGAVVPLRSVIRIAKLGDLLLCSVTSFRIFGLTESTSPNGRVITRLGWTD
eukprot:1967464-Rhodomonas_salina.1